MTVPISPWQSMNALPKVVDPGFRKGTDRGFSQLLAEKPTWLVP